MACPSLSMNTAVSYALNAAFCNMHVGCYAASMLGDSEELSPFEAAALYRDLCDLRWHWGDAYRITWAHGQYTAARRDGRGTPLCSGDIQWMYNMIAADYHACPVPRDPPLQVVSLLVSPN